MLRSGTGRPLGVAGPTAEPSIVARVRACPANSCGSWCAAASRCRGWCRCCGYWAGFSPWRSALSWCDRHSRFDRPVVADQGRQPAGRIGRRDAAAAGADVRVRLATSPLFCAPGLAPLMADNRRTGSAVSGQVWCGAAGRRTGNTRRDSFSYPGLTRVGGGPAANGNWQRVSSAWSRKRFPDLRRRVRRRTGTNPRKPRPLWTSWYRPGPIEVGADELICPSVGGDGGIQRGRRRLGKRRERWGWWHRTTPAGGGGHPVSAHIRAVVGPGGLRQARRGSRHAPANR